MEVQHFSHEHPLILNKEDHKDDDERWYCRVCSETISGPSYSCGQRNCESNLHTICAELPGEMTHPMHPEHPLTLLQVHPDVVFKCDVCLFRWRNLTYYCSLCKFNIDPQCALMALASKIEHESHKQHPLTLLPRPALVPCDACGKDHRGMSYVCTTCPFWVNYNCASLPTTVKRSDHEHSLTLAYSFPYESLRWSSFCCICTEAFSAKRWLYYCADCRYFAHVDCPEPMPNLSRDLNNEIELDDDDDDLRHNPISLPVPDESINLVTQFLKKISLRENKRANELNHFSHNHPLVFSDVKSNDELCSSSKFPPLNQLIKNDARCNACMRPITAPFYSCNQCNFFLHECCAELPRKLQHPLHEEHRLSLKKAPNFFDLFQCKGCERFCNGFTFRCRYCEYYLDVNCASLPHIITHEAHDHLVILEPDSGDSCNACSYAILGFQYTCDRNCRFNLHIDCALLPRTFRHRYDTHPFILTCSPVKNHPAEYICELCEIEMNPQQWFYHCGECDQSICTGCTGLVPQDFSYVNFGGTVNLEGHPHLLTLVGRASKLKCNLCDKFIKDGILYECSQCDFHVHIECASSCSKSRC